MVVTRRIMENRVESMEQRMTQFEGTIEQIRQIVTEQQSRPQVTVDQIRQLIQDQPGRRRGSDDDEEGEGSARSSLSRESRHRHRRHSGGEGFRGMGSRRRLEIPIFKGEDAYGWLV